MQIELQPEHMKGDFGRIAFESLDEIVAAREATHRALIRKRLNVVNGMVHGNMISRLVKWVPTKVAYHGGKKFSPEIKALHSFMHSAATVQAASFDRNDYSQFAESESSATGDRFRLATCSWMGGEADFVAKAIINYHDPDRDGREFGKGWLVPDNVVEGMIEQVQEAVTYQGSVAQLQQNPDVA